MLGEGFRRENKKFEKRIKPKSKRRRRRLKSKEEFLDSFYKSILSEINKNGYKSIRVGSLMKSVGIGKRSENLIENLKEEFKKRKLYPYPVVTKEIALKNIIKIYRYPVRQLGELFDSERELESYIAMKRLYKKLNIKKVDRQYSPLGTKDRLDFKGVNENEEIVLELKNKGGGKSAVEQVLRYAGLLKLEHPNAPIRKILVTGVQSYEIALAIKGMKKEDRENFEWYLYKYSSAKDTLEFIRVNTDEF